MQLSTGLLESLPLCQRVNIGPERIDPMGHMNVRHYMGIFDDAGWEFFTTFGMTQAFYDDGVGGAFALQHFICYLAEVREKETVAVRTRLLGRSAKRIHFMMFMINESRDNLAATLEALGAYADMKQRRTAPWPADIARQIDQLLERDRALGWNAPICGVIKP